MPDSVKAGNPKPYPETTHLDLKGNELKKFKIGDKVEVRITGVVHRMSDKLSDEDYDKPSISIKVTSKKVVRKGEFDDMMNDSEDD